MNTAIVTLATGVYRIGAQVLFKSIQNHNDCSDVRFVVIGDPVDFAEYIPITEDYSSIKVNQKEFKEVAKKFFALTLPFDRIVLIDADCLCVGDCSLLWSKRLDSLKLYAVHDVASNTYYASQIKELGLLPELLFNGGVYVFNEPRQWASSMLEQIATGQCEAYDGGDQGYLNCYAQRNFMEVGNLPIEYNCILDINQPQVPTAAQRIIHFTGLNANPWNAECPNDWRIPYFKAWDAALKQCNP